MDARDLPGQHEQVSLERLNPGRLIGLQGRLARPFWGLMGIWAALCGALASNHLEWNGVALLTLALVLLLADLAWGSLWDLAVGTCWRVILSGRPPMRPPSLGILPYTRPESPAGRLFHRFSRVVTWWREIFWPTAGPAVLGFLAAVALTAVLTVLLPERLRVFNAGLVVIIGVGVVQGWRGRVPLAGQALMLVGLSWLAGHAAFTTLAWPSVAVAISFSASAWGVLRVLERQQGGLWLLNGGQVVAAALLAMLKQPLAAGAVGLLLLGQIVLQPLLRTESNRELVVRRTWTWQMVAMLVAALAIP